NPSFVTLGRAEPSLPVEIVLDLLERPLAHKQPGEEADHHPGHLGTDRIRAVLKPIDQLLELPATVRTASPAAVDRRAQRLDVLDVASNRLLFGPYFVEAPVDATGPATESRLREPPLFLVQVVPDRFADLVPGPGPPPARRWERSPPVVVEDAAP